MNNKSDSEECMEKIQVNDQDFINFVVENIETGETDVISYIPLKAFDIACDNIQPNNEENERNPGSLSVLHGYYLNSNISNDQQTLNIFPSHVIQGCESGRKNHVQSIDEIEVSHVDDHITTCINEPKVYQKMNSCEVSGIHFENMQTSQELLQTLESVNGAHCIEKLSTSRNYPVPMDLQKDNTNYVCNRNRNASDNENLMNYSQAPKRPGDENPRIIVQHFATYSRKGRMNYEFSTKENKSNQVTLQVSHLTGNDHEFHTLKKSPCNQGMQMCGDVGKNILFVATQNIASNMSISEIAPNNHDPSKISDSVASNRENACSNEDMVEVSGPSGNQRNENNPNLSVDMLQPLYEAEKVNVLTCKVCKAEISKHMRLPGEKIFYECCICNYNNSEEDNLHVHSFTHFTFKFCNICLKGHTEGDSHDGQKTCSLCPEKCDCTTRLKEHLLVVHDDHFAKNCWGCFINVDGHRTKVGKICYACCLCSFKSHRRKDWEEHNETHRPKLFCKVCREEYPLEERDKHQREYMCVCNLNFKCKGEYEKHSLDHYLNELCILCNKIFLHHEIFNELNVTCKCCVCLAEVTNRHILKCHLFGHVDLNVFKCVMCGKRFPRNCALTTHSKFCKAVPYECEICGARFPRIYFLNKHRSVKHGVE